MDYAQRNAEASAYYQQSMQRVKDTKEPDGQKFHVGQRVWISNELPKWMCHFTKGKWATVEYTHAHAYGGNNIDSYSLDIDGHGSTAWYDEYLLSLDGSNAVIPEEHKHYPDKCYMCITSKKMSKDFQVAMDKVFIDIISDIKKVGNNEIR